MAVELFRAFPLEVSASILKEGDGAVILHSIQYGSNLAFVESDLTQDDEAKFQRGIGRILKTILLKVSPSGGYNTSTRVDDVVELSSPGVKFPDGGHKCPYFPCPTCHRSRALFPDVEGKSKKVISFSIFDSISDHFTCESGGKTSSHLVCPAFSMHPDKGHKCAEFPCPLCHRNDRS